MNDLLDWAKARLAARPLWMNLLLGFCIYMSFVYMPWDLFVKPVAVDEEVWFGVRFHGAAAKWLAIPHWFVYAAGMIGFWRMRPWMWPWASLYVGQVAISMIVWPLLYVGGIGGLVVGVVSAGLFGLLARALWRARPLFEDKPLDLRERYGDWALITGASAGLGACYARAFAAEGLHLVLAARREDRLRELASELEKRYGIEVRIVAVDLSTPEGPERLVAAVEDLDLAILVNNAGVGYAGRVEKQDPERLDAMVRLNCGATVALTARLLPRLRERGRGAILILGSVAGAQPLPLHALYSATKAFDNFFAEGLWGELRGTGIDVLGVQPGVTETEFQAAADEIAHHGEAPEDVVMKSLQALGHGPSWVSGAFNWARANAAARLLPRSWQALIAKQVMEQQTPDAMR